jgi:hypothetical protein
MKPSTIFFGVLALGLGAYAISASGNGNGAAKPKPAKSDLDRLTKAVVDEARLAGEGITVRPRDAFQGVGPDGIVGIGQKFPDQLQGSQGTLIVAAVTGPNAPVYSHTFRLMYVSNDAIREAVQSLASLNFERALVWA